MPKKAAILFSLELISLQLVFPPSQLLRLAFTSSLCTYGSTTANDGVGHFAGGSREMFGGGDGEESVWSRRWILFREARSLFALLQHACFLADCGMCTRGHGFKLGVLDALTACSRRLVIGNMQIITTESTHSIVIFVVLHIN